MNSKPSPAGGRGLGGGGEASTVYAGPLLLALSALTLAASATLPAPILWLLATALIVTLGVPHGALDGEIARPILRARFGAAWFLVFALPYLALSGAVLATWRWSPLGMLAGFLALSVWHFGAEDAPPAQCAGLSAEAEHAAEILVRGGMPIALPLLIHPAATMAVFAAAAQAPLTASPAWLWAAALAWAVLAACRASRAAARGHWRSLAVLAGWAALFAILPPLAAFTLYFVGAHAPAHMHAIIRHPTRAPRVDSLPSAVRRSLPLTAVTIAVGGALWPLYHGTLEVHALGLTLQLLSALTLPHMLLDAAMARHERRQPGQVTASTFGVMLPYRPSRAV